MRGQAAQLKKTESLPDRPATDAELLLQHLFAQRTAWWIAARYNAAPDLPHQIIRDRLRPVAHAGAGKWERQCRATSRRRQIQTRSCLRTWSSRLLKKSFCEVAGM